MGLTNPMHTHLFGNFFWPAGFNFQLLQQCFFQLGPIFIPGVISEVQKTEVQGRNNVQICKHDDSHLLSPEQGKKKIRKQQQQKALNTHTQVILTFCVTSLQKRGPSEDPFYRQSSFSHYINVNKYHSVNVDSNKKYLEIILPHLQPRWFKKKKKLNSFVLKHVNIVPVFDTN